MSTVAALPPRALRDRARDLLLPLYLLQGLHVRRVTPKLPEPDGAREGAIGSGPPLRLLILGDSAAAGVGATHQDHALAGQLGQRLAPHFALQWRLFARTGDRTRDTLARLEAEPDWHCDVVVTSLGVNDATALQSPAGFATDQQALHAHLRARRGARLLLISGLPPVHSFPALPQPLRGWLGAHVRRLDVALAQLVGAHADAEHLPFGELPDAAMMASDGFHPGTPIYAAWADVVAQRIRVRCGVAGD